ncbi:MAG: Flp pilus assembly complex ATPase component TadA [Deltaproteobacteria bacterium]|nr:Flp pilus assembly complex ATPase component TadA [Deltaproteobacteria bacterium]
MDANAHSTNLQAFANLLVRAGQGGCSDVHVRTNAPPMGRRGGRLVPLGDGSVSSDAILELIQATAKRPLAAASLEYSFDIGDALRARCHAFRDSDGWAVAVRLVPHAIPSFSDLRLPPVVKTFVEPRPGLLLITGPMGTGKSTTAAAILSAIAARDGLRIVTLEDPIEHRIHGAPSCVSQREIGRDCVNIEQGLRDALREDADVLFVGEIRTGDELEVALHAADMGISVVATFHTAGALQTVNRLVSMHAPDAQQIARERLADSLRAVISQRLLPRKNSAARVLTTEVMVSGPTTRECVRDLTKLKGLPAVLERGTDVGMHTFDQSLLQLCSSGLVDVEAAIAAATSPGNLRRALNLAAMNAA